jgi:hypothetical protein
MARDILGHGQQPKPTADAGSPWRVHLAKAVTNIMGQAILFGFVLACFFYLFTEAAKGPPKAGV